MCSVVNVWDIVSPFVCSNSDWLNDGVIGAILVRPIRKHAFRTSQWFSATSTSLPDKPRFVVSCKS